VNSHQENQWKRVKKEERQKRLKCGESKEWNKVRNREDNQIKESEKERKMKQND